MSSSVRTRVVRAGFASDAHAALAVGFGDEPRARGAADVDDVQGAAGFAGEVDGDADGFELDVDRARAR
jgi:hypothetical protein